MRRFSLFIIICSLACAADAQTSWRDSLATLSAQLRRTPGNIDLRLRKAAVNIELGQWEYAVEEYGRVLERAPGNLAAHFFRAYAYVQLRQLPMAVIDYEAVLAKSPSHFEARMGLAEVKRQMGRQAETMDQLNLLVQQHPDSAMAWALRAEYEVELGKGWQESAEYDWEQAVRLAPTREDFRAALARIRREKK